MDAILLQLWRPRMFTYRWSDAFAQICVTRPGRLQALECLVLAKTLGPRFSCKSRCEARLHESTLLRAELQPVAQMWRESEATVPTGI